VVEEVSGMMSIFDVIAGASFSQIGIAAGVTTFAMLVMRRRV
jgi:hypothetical protein